MEKNQRLSDKAREIRRRVFERVIKAGMGHLGGTFSCLDIFVALYYGDVLKYRINEPRWPDRDRLVVGKGHACLALYEIWADINLLHGSRVDQFGDNGSSLSGQLNLDTPGAEYNSGSLGHALGIAAGMALAAGMNKRDYRSYALIGDGECAEGSIWEAFMFAGEYQLENLTCIIDRNRLGVTSRLEENEGTGNLANKILQCGWNCRVIDGHNLGILRETFRELDNNGKPLAIIADTVKGKGVSFMENEVKWHHSVPSGDAVEIARRELRGEIC